MQLTTILVLAVAALTTAQDAPPAGLPSGLAGLGGFGGRQGGSPFGGGKGGARRGGGRGKGGQPGRFCGFQCFLEPFKASGCKIPWPKNLEGALPGAAGATAPHARRQIPSSPRRGSGKGFPDFDLDNLKGPLPFGLDATAIKASRDCFCGNAGMRAAVETCVPKSCAAKGGSGAFITRMFNGICTKAPGFAPLALPVSAAGAGAPAGAPMGAMAGMPM